MNKLKILLLLLLIGMMGCYEPNVKSDETNYIISAINGPIKIINIEGCQYFYLLYDRSASLIHKGNCNNPIHIHNGGSHE